MVNFMKTLAPQISLDSVFAQAVCCDVEAPLGFTFDPVVAALSTAPSGVESSGETALEQRRISRSRALQQVKKQDL